YFKYNKIRAYIIFDGKVLPNIILILKINSILRCIQYLSSGKAIKNSVTVSMNRDSAIMPQEISFGFAKRLLRQSENPKFFNNKSSY
ncbi:hypothetical protein HZS_4745, partial [Henneguya salminicola]